MSFLTEHLKTSLLSGFLIVGLTTNTEEDFSMTSVFRVTVVVYNYAEDTSGTI